jgi:hypothetical protein
MQVAVRPSRNVMSHSRAIVCTGAMALFLFVSPAARAADNNLTIDSSLIASLQLRAQQASPREQVQMYADLVDKISLLASKEVADGEIEKAELTLHQLEACTAQMETNLQRDSKGLKKTELLLHNTHRRLADLVRSASGDMKPMVQSAVSHLDHAQTTLLSAIFEH